MGVQRGLWYFSSFICINISLGYMTFGNSVILCFWLYDLFQIISLAFWICALNVNGYEHEDIIRSYTMFSDMIWYLCNQWCIRIRTQTFILVRVRVRIQKGNGVRGGVVRWIKHICIRINRIVYTLFYYDTKCVRFCREPLWIFNIV